MRTRVVGIASLKLVKGGCGVFQCENKLNVSSFGPISKQFVEKYNQRPLRPPLSKAYIAYIKIFLMLHITSPVRFQI